MNPRRGPKSFNRNPNRLDELWRALETLVSIALATSPLSLAAFAAITGA